MNANDPFALTFPQRQSNHYGNWVAVYLDPLPGSGERICVGVIAADTSRVCARSTHSLERFHGVYGMGAAPLCHAANIVMLEATAIAEERGLDSLGSGLMGIEGLSISESRRGAGRDLDDLAALALQQASAIVGLAVEQAPAAVREKRAGTIARSVRKLVTAVRPALARGFGRSFGLSSAARPTAYGFVGEHIVANFAALGGTTPEALAGQVDRAKARLWDLEQLQEGILRDVFGTPMRRCDFELLACPPSTTTKRALVRTRIVSPALLNEAVDTLEREADRFRIRWRYLPDLQDIARFLLSKEAA